VRASASAPASSANLGPGFDFLALALEIRCRVTADQAEQWSAPDGAEPIVIAVAAALGVDRPFAVSVESDIPIQRGLGSSAALAVAAGAAALSAVGREIDHDALFEAAASVDGHPDNAAAAVYGGLVAVAPTGVRRLSLSPTLAVILGVPDTTLATSEARRALPETITHAAAARSAARAAFLVEGLRTGDAPALAAAGHDELHEEPRAALSPVTVAMVEAARAAGALHAAWSGAGPSVVALATADAAEEVAAALLAVAGEGGRVLRPQVAQAGVR
jgi:homoserine kinase